MGPWALVGQGPEGPHLGLHGPGPSGPHENSGQFHITDFFSNVAMRNCHVYIYIYMSSFLDTFWIIPTRLTFPFSKCNEFVSFAYLVIPEGVAIDAFEHTYS